MKGFLRKVLLIASFGAALTFYGCNKDFTQDIEDVRNDLTTALEEQNSTLTAAINQAKEDAQKYADEAAKAAKDYADQVAAAAKAEAIEEAEKLADAALESAKTYADQVAKSEAAKVKQELLEQIKTDLENTLADAKKYTDEQIKDLKDELLVKITELSSRIDGIDEEINTLKSTVEAQGLKIDELVKADEAMKLRLDALEAFQKTMEDWKKTVDTSLTELADADKALAEKIATESARIDQLIKDLEDLETRLMALILKNQKDIAALQADVLAKYNDLQGKIDALKATMDQYKEELDAADQVLQDNIDQLGKDLRKEMAEAIDALDSELRTFIEAELADLKEYFDGEIAAVRKELSDKAEELKKYIDDEITALDSKIMELLGNLEQVISDRLTSISLIPDLYVGGIETFGVRGVAFTAVQVDPQSEAIIVPLAEQTSVIPWYAADVVRYHLSPSNVTEDGIKALDYLIENATIVKSAASNDLIKVAGYKVNSNNELEVEIYRIPSYSNDKYVFPIQSLINSEPNVQTKLGFEWPTAALKAGIADNLLLNDEKEANVISEYSAYADLLSDIHITDSRTPCTKIECNKFYTEYATAILPESEANVSANYDSSIDLLPLVLAHVSGYNNEVVSLENLKKMGLDFRFAIPTAPQPVGDNGTDQQKFIKMNEDGHTFVSIVPGEYLNNEAAIGRTPIVRVELYEVATDRIVDVQWIKIVWVKEAFPPQDLGTIPPTFTDYLDCTEFYRFSLDWAQVNQYIIGAIKNYDGELAGMSHADYLFYYGENPTFVLSSDKIPSELLHIEANLDSDPNADPKTAVYTFVVDYNGIAGIIDEILNSDEKKATRNIAVTIKPRAEVASYVGDLSFNINVEWTLPEKFLPTVQYNLTHNWIVKDEKEGFVAQVNPVGYDDSSNNSDSKVRYEYDMFKLFNPIAANANAFLTNLDNASAEDYDYSCRTWDMQFAKSNNGHQPYYFPGNFAGNGTDAGYQIIKNSDWTAMMSYNHEQPTINWYNSKSPVLNHIWFNIADPVTYRDGDEVAARELLNEISKPVDERVKIPVKIMMNITPDFTNIYEVKTFDLTAIIPVTLPEVRIDDSFVDYNKDGQTIEIPTLKYFGTSMFPVTDFEGKVIADNQFKYYGIEQPVWHLDTDEVYTNMVIDGSGNVVVNPELNPNNKEDRDKMTLVKDSNIDWSYDENMPYSMTTIYVRNSHGAPLVEPVTLWIKVDYKHMFADYSKYISVIYDPNKVNAQ